MAGRRGRCHRPGRRRVDTPGRRGGRSTLTEIDDVRVYQCSATASGVRGDFDGDGRADHLAGYFPYDNRLNLVFGGSQGALTATMTGLTSTHWYGSPGDVNGDHKADLLSVDSDELLLFPGDGASTTG